ncbi:SIMPL domain-containing protein [Capnocytophaga sp. ARDL2]|uniref:SIMPL domain-containing protein n=1 Tax=Capnocytophaga sp. ARDL2 TaxID=3238809 RepID=UPI0035592770
MNKTFILSSFAIAGVLTSMYILGDAIKNRNQADETITVTGLGTKKFTSDLISWSGNFTKSNYDLKSAYKELLSDKEEIHKYLLSKGIKSDEIIFSAVDISKNYNYNTDTNGNSYAVFSGYLLTQSISIESKEVEKIENISRNITEIINLGVEFTSSPPQYFYTKLSDVKHEMIATATQDAKERAEKIASNAGAKLGKLKKANMGVIQITAPNSNEDFHYGGAFNTSSKEKEASITMKLEYKIR